MHSTAISILIMKKIVALSLCILVTTVLSAQKEDFIWLLGGGIQSTDSLYKSCKLDFSFTPPIITHIDEDLPFLQANSSICDSSGKLLCYSNGENIYNSDYKIMEGGENYYPTDAFTGVPVKQGHLLLPFPTQSNKKIFIYGTSKVVYPPSGATLGFVDIRYAIIDFTYNAGLGKVIQRDINVPTDTMMPTQMTAVRHGNGRDWWVLMPHYKDTLYYRYILSPEGLEYAGKQAIKGTDLGLGQACFSPDGKWYARFNWHGIVPDSSFSTIELYRFDRCSGLLSDRVSKTYDLSGLGGKPGGVAFSPSSRYMYVSRWDTIFQYDLAASDIVASEMAVAGYDGFTADFGAPTRFYSLLLAPDEKIYCCVSNYNSRYLHVIAQPDSAGAACAVQQHSVELPVFNNFVLPNMPFYRLWEWGDSPCDTLSSVSASEAAAHDFAMRLVPNPAGEQVELLFSQPMQAPASVKLYDLTGQLMLDEPVATGVERQSISLERYPNGWYIVCLATKEQVLSRKALSIIR